ncbi:prolyl oligopeptidase PreP (S9A serine peptidase family) [Filibacter limicola]|uniref:Prolyl oligopeptidase PreP (S9A serine peptidase family) n=1 Tax=Sporosarcina limicola TaxID=34101 RepID=A0A927RCJ0_9BACL|nr:prolyl oligopeptidase PreP (S9A serine peptidase family) [Sporosarcina limicola]
MKNKAITRQRLIIETLEQVLPKAKIYIMNDNGETVKYLPLQQLENQTPPPVETTKEEGGN